MTRTPDAVLYGQPWWLFLLDIAAKSMIFAWVFVRTGGSVVIAVLLHAASNVFAVSPVVSVTDTLTLPLIATCLEWVLAGLLLTWAGPSLVRRVTDPHLTYADGSRTVGAAGIEPATTGL